MRHLLPFLAVFLLFTGCEPDEVETPDVAGCTDPDALNFDPDASIDDGSCEYDNPESECAEFVEYDGHAYSVVDVGGKCWFAENLKTTVYANGDPIETYSSGMEFATSTNGAFTHYGQSVDGVTCSEPECSSQVQLDSGEMITPNWNACSDAAQTVANWGLLYNVYAIQDDRNLCPAGFHIATQAEFESLGSAHTYMDPISDYWCYPETDPSGAPWNNPNTTGLGLKPAGRMSFQQNELSPYWTGEAIGGFEIAWFWTSSIGDNLPVMIWVDHPGGSWGFYEMSNSIYDSEGQHYSVRCVQD